LQAREDRVDVRLLHGELRGPQVVEGMAEGVHAVAVDVGDGAGDRQVHVALDEGDADGGAGGEVRHPLGRRRAAARPHRGLKPSEENTPAPTQVAGSKPKTMGSEAAGARRPWAGRSPRAQRPASTWVAQGPAQGSEQRLPVRGAGPVAPNAVGTGSGPPAARLLEWRQHLPDGRDAQWSPWRTEAVGHRAPACHQ
jgi:hypothetical protein